MFELTKQGLSKALEAIGCDATEYWRRDSRGQREFLSLATDTACKMVTETWPDWDLGFADTLPREVAIGAHSTSLQAFGTLKPKQRAVAGAAARAMQGWFENLRTKASKEFVPLDQTRSIPEFLLHRYLTREEHQEWKELLDRHTVPETLSTDLVWCSFPRTTRSGPSTLDKLSVLWNEFQLAFWVAFLLALFVYMSTITTHEGVGVIVTLFCVLLLVTVAYTIRALPTAFRDQELGYPGTMLERMKADWPEGRPRLLSNPRGYLHFFYDCVGAGLILHNTSNHEADRLRAALGRCWSGPMNPNYRSAFISHSHAQADLASGLAEGLRARGVNVGLDAWELMANASEAEVDQWIVRTVLSSETMIYILSNQAIRSGWVEREIGWEFRLCPIRRTTLLPYFILMDDVAIDLDGYPKARVIRAEALRGEACVAMLDELAVRLSCDAFLRFYGLRYGVHFGISSDLFRRRKKWSDITQLFKA